jgi:hypothetical protein
MPTEYRQLEQPDKRKTRLMVGLLLLAVGFAFYLSPVRYISDSGFSLLMDEAIIHERTPNMIAYKVPRGSSWIFVNDGYPWSIKIIKGRLLYMYPWGSSLLSLPAVALFNSFGLRVAPHHVYNGANELRMQAVIAAFLSAITVWIIYETAVVLLSPGWALAVALTAAFGTPIWSSESRSLWPQTWAVLLVAAAIWILMSETNRPILLGTVLAWSCFVRPQLLPDIVLITGYVMLFYDSRSTIIYISTGAAWAIPLSLTMHAFTGGLFSPFYRAGLLDFTRDFGWRLYGLLFSASRGLFVFVPVFLICVYWAIRYWERLPRGPLATVALLTIALHLGMLASWESWWGGGSYGPRILLEVITWFVLLGILGLRAFLEDSALSFRRRSAGTVLAAVLVFMSVAMNAPGALCQNSIVWRNFDSQHLEALWDWHRPQFLCWWH